MRQVALAARAGIHLIQLRERDLGARALLDLTRLCVEAVHGTRARVVVNDRVDVALAGGAHGVHLRGDSAPTGRVRGLTGPQFLIGRSVHTREEAVRETGEGGDYLLFGTIFASESKPGVPPAGLSALAAAVSATSLPVLAIGGLTADRLEGVARAGAAGFAAIGMFRDGSPEALRTLLERAGRAFDTGAVARKG